MDSDDHLIVGSIITRICARKIKLEKLKTERISKFYINIIRIYDF